MVPTINFLFWIADEANISLNVSFLDIVFGKFDISNDFLLVYHTCIHLVAKRFIYKCKYNFQSYLISYSLQSKVEGNIQIRIICTLQEKNGILLKRYRKWNSLSLFSDLRFYTLKPPRVRNKCIRLQ